MVIIQLPIGYESSTSISGAPWDVTTTQQEKSTSPYMMMSNSGLEHDKENTKQVDNNHEVEESTKTKRKSTTCTSLCFKIHSNEDSYIELSFGMQLSPTDSPTFTAPITTNTPTNYPSKRPTNRPTVTHSSSSSSPITTNLPTSYLPTILTTPLPTRAGTNVGPIKTNDLRITLFGINSIPNIEEWNELMSLYINQYFNIDSREGGEKKWAFHVDTDVSLTGQRSNIVVGQEEGVLTNEAKRKKKLRQLDVDQQRRRRRLQSSSSSSSTTSNNGEREPFVEIIYNQVSTYNIRPEFCGRNVHYSRTIRYDTLTI